MDEQKKNSPQTPQGNAEKSSLKKSFAIFNKEHSAKQGIFPAVVTVLVILLVIVFNAVVGQIPTRLSQFDLSDNQLYTVSDVSVEYLKKLDKDVDIIVLYLKDQVDGRITKFIDTYADLSEHLHVQYVDPIAFPSMLTTYSTESGSVVVRCQETGRFQTFKLGDVIDVDMYLYYVLNQYVESSFDCEGLLTSAVNFVVEEGSKTVYATYGHGEAEVGESTKTLLSRNRCSIKTVNLLVAGAVPKDCDVLLINDPANDLAAEELATLEKYLDEGGQVVFLPSSVLNKAMPRWDSFLERYGLRLTENYLMEFGNQYGANNYLFFPLVSLDADVSTNLTEQSTLLLQNARGLRIDNDKPEGYRMETFMATSDSAALLQADGTYERGNFVLGAILKGTNGGRLTVVSAPSLIGEEVVGEYQNIDNQQLFLDMITVSLGDLNTSFSIEPVSLITQQNNVRAGGFWSMIYIAFIPAAVLVFGFVHWLRRRRK